MQKFVFWLVIVFRELADIYTRRSYNLHVHNCWHIQTGLLFVFNRYMPLLYVYIPRAQCKTILSPYIIWSYNSFVLNPWYLFYVRCIFKIFTMKCKNEFKEIFDHLSVLLAWIKPEFSINCCCQDWFQH